MQDELHCNCEWTAISLGGMYLVRGVTPGGPERYPGVEGSTWVVGKPHGNYREGAPCSLNSYTNAGDIGRDGHLTTPVAILKQHRNKNHPQWRIYGG